MQIMQHSAHLDQMIRQTRAHHVSLSEMADKKYGISKGDQKLTKEFYKNK